MAGGEGAAGEMIYNWKQNKRRGEEKGLNRDRKINLRERRSC